MRCQGIKNVRKNPVESFRLIVLQSHSAFREHQEVKMHTGYRGSVSRQDLAEQCVPALVDWGACEELETAARAAHVATMLEELSQDNQRSARVREGCVQAVWLGCLKRQVISGNLAVATRALPMLLQLAR